ncbi:MAG: ABC transporter substrate-binding protein [Trueperaceae bacterium]
MKKLLLSLGIVFFAGLSSAQDLIDVCFQSKWFPQAQFAGYFVAQDKGFYEEEGLNVTILDGGSVNPSVQVSSGNCDFGTDWIANMLVQREAGLNVVQIAQVYQDSGYRMVALKDSGIETFADLAGKKVGVWAFGNEFVSQAIFAQQELTSDLDPTVTEPDVSAVVYEFDPSLVFPDEVDVASAMTYNELNQIVGLGNALDTLNILNPADIDAQLLEDNIFTTPELLANENFKDSGVSGREIAERFLRATIKGWDYAVANQEEAVTIVIGYCGDTCNGSGTTQNPEIHQTWQMAEVAKLVKPTPETTIGALDPAAFERSVELLLQVGLIKNPVTLEDVVDNSVYEAVSAQ